MVIILSGLKVILQYAREGEIVNIYGNKSRSSRHLCCDGVRLKVRLFVRSCDNLAGK